MTPRTGSYSEKIDTRDLDPWALGGVLADAQRHAATVASLPRPRYHSTLDLSCASGVLTESLATRCDHLLSTEVIPVALQRVEDQLRRNPSIWFEQRSISDQWPPGPFDLIVLSEIGYHFETVGSP
jgi:methylase of polypeptide subunit release factors